LITRVQNKQDKDQKKAVEDEMGLKLDKTII
jgi:hypothetical protein